MNDLTDNDSAVVTGATAVGVAIGSCIFPGIGSAVGAGIGAITGGIAIIIRAVNENK